jgi:hypothetical protein
MLFLLSIMCVLLTLVQSINLDAAVEIPQSVYLIRQASMDQDRNKFLAFHTRPELVLRRTRKVLWKLDPTEENSKIFTLSSRYTGRWDQGNIYYNFFIQAGDKVALTKSNATKFVAFPAKGRDAYYLKVYSEEEKEETFLSTKSEDVLVATQGGVPWSFEFKSFN